MLVVAIHDDKFISKCIPLAKTFILADNSRYVFRDGYAVAFATFQKYTKPACKGFEPTQSAQAAKLRVELDAVNAMRSLLALCKAELPNYVRSFSVKTANVDIWERAFVVVTDTYVNVHFPDAEGSAEYAKENMWLETSRPFKAAITEALVTKLQNICTAACLKNMTYSAAASTLERAFFMREPGRNYEAYGYALVVLMHNEFVRHNKLL